MLIIWAKNKQTKTTVSLLKGLFSCFLKEMIFVSLILFILYYLLLFAFC